jgi:hypothetical protein
MSTMDDHNDSTALSTLSGNAAIPAATRAESAAAPNPFVLVQDRLQNRWKLCLAIGLGLGLAL